MSFILLHKNQVGGHQEVTKARDKKNPIERENHYFKISGFSSKRLLKFRMKETTQMNSIYNYVQ